MKREMLENRYLFRGKRVDNNEWAYGDLIHTPENKTRIIWFEPMYSDDIHFYKDYNFMVDKETIGQFTGLTDKNGVKIFEGDIVRWDDETNGERWRVAVVEINPDLQFRIIRIECDFIQSAQEGYIFKFGRFIYTDTHKYLEIIGNIHDDAKL